LGDRFPLLQGEKRAEPCGAPDEDAGETRFFQKPEKGRQRPEVEIAPILRQGRVHRGDHTVPLKGCLLVHVALPLPCGLWPPGVKNSLGPSYRQIVQIVNEIMLDRDRFDRTSAWY